MTADPRLAREDGTIMRDQQSRVPIRSIAATIGMVLLTAALSLVAAPWAKEKSSEYVERFAKRIIALGVEKVAQEIGLCVPMPPSSLIGVASLWEPDVLVEVEATAVLD